MTTDRLVRKWAAGGAEIPAELAAWLETLATGHAAAPPPMMWCRRSRANPADHAAVLPRDLTAPAWSRP